MRGANKMLSLFVAIIVIIIMLIVARCVTVSRRASSNASRYIGEMRYCASPIRAAMN